MSEVDWYTQMIDPPFIELIKLLRNNGFNTVWCCAHGPHPYIAIDVRYQFKEDQRLEELLKKNGYINYRISTNHYGSHEVDLLTISFKTNKKEKELMDISEFKEA